MSKGVTHLIIGLGKGGAETMLYQVLKYRSESAPEQRVISLGASHYYEGPLRQMGYEVTELNLRKKPVSTYFKLFRLLRGTDILCCWMYHANFLGYLAGRLAGVQKIIWCIRHSNLDPEVNSRLTLAINRICARWSRHVSAIVYNGKQARKVHEEIGYCREKGTVVDNGCDCMEYAPDEQAAEALRRELHIGEEQKIVLSVTKNTPIKDIPTMIESFGKLHESLPDTTAILCGNGVDASDEKLAALCKQAGLTVGEQIHLLGLRHDVPRLLAGCDLYVLHSAGEAFPNALLQAMSCGCACVTTDVGDARRILAQDDCVVPPGNASALTEKMAEVLSLPTETMQEYRIRNRQRVQETFDIRQIVKTYEALYGTKE